MKTEYHLKAPLKPTLRRYWSIFIRRSGLSIYRSLEYEALRQLHYNGRILDFGGGRSSHYNAELVSWIKHGFVESINIDAEISPDYKIDKHQSFPMGDNTYDMVVSINTLEHVYELDFILSEISRVLVAGGRTVFAVPFIFRVHGSPEDYNRPTPTWWTLSLKRVGISDVTVTPLVWDVMTTGLSITEGVGLFPHARRAITPLSGLFYAALRGRGSGSHYPRDVSEKLANYALGYIIEGVKHGKNA